VTNDQIAIFSLLGITLIFFIWGKWRYDMVAMTSLLAAVLIGLVPADKAFLGFSEPVVITVACALILSKAIALSGILEILLARLEPVMRTASLQIFVFCLMVGLSSFFMKNIGALALFIPATLVIAEKYKRSPSEMLMPLSFASLIGGMCTLIGSSSNLMISALRERYIGTPFQMFDFTPIGIGIFAISIVYLTVAWRILPKDRVGATSPHGRFTIEDYISEVHVGEGSPFVGKTIAQAEKETEGELTIHCLLRNGHQRISAYNRSLIRVGDVLMVETDPKILAGMATSKEELLTKNSEVPEGAKEEDISVTEVVLTDESPLIGQTALSYDLRSRYGINLLAIRRKGRSIRERIKYMPLDAGDVLVLQGLTQSMPDTLQTLRCLPLAERQLQLGRDRNPLFVAGVMALAIALSVSKILPLPIAFLGAVMLMLFFKRLRLQEAYDAIDWPIIILLGAMIPVTGAMESSGAAQLVANQIAAHAQSFAPIWLLGFILAVSMAVTPFLNNVATVLVMGPIAAGLAKGMGLNVDPFLLAVAIGSACDFLTPIGHQANTLIMGPGGYRFGDYWKLGLPLSLLVIVAGTLLIAQFWPLIPA